MKEIKLKKCPYCGSSDVVADFWGKGYIKGPGCKNCGCTAETVEEWNMLK